jgi:hypothetical protein
MYFLHFVIFICLFVKFILHLYKFYNYGNAIIITQQV